MGKEGIGLGRQAWVGRAAGSAAWGAMVVALAAAFSPTGIVSASAVARAPAKGAGAAAGGGVCTSVPLQLQAAGHLRSGLQGPEAGVPPPISFTRRDGLFEPPAGDNPTTMAVGPDGRLYVGTYSGNIYALTIDPNTHAVTGSQTITAVHDLPNFNDDGTSAPNVVGRLVLGITFDPTLPGTPTMYVSNGDPRLYDCSLDTRSSTISRLSAADSFHTATTVLTGIPRSRRDHALNGLHFGPDHRLYVAVGSNTNLGAPSIYFGNQPEAYLSGTILAVDVHDITGPVNLRNVQGPGDMPVSPGGGLPPPVQIFVRGLRNPYDFAWAGPGGDFLYVNDNGSNHGFGMTPASADGCPNGQAVDPPDLEDSLFRVSQNPGVFYAGHPNPTRAAAEGDPGQCILNGGNLYSPPLTPGPNYVAQMLTYGPNGGSVDGMTVYPIGAMAGNLISATFSDDNLLRRVVLDSSGNLDLSNGGLSTMAPDSEFTFRNPLAVATDAAGTIYVAESSLWSKGLPEVDELLPQGGGQTALATLSPTNVAFSPQRTGTTSGTQQVTFTNTTSATVSWTSVSVTGGNAQASEFRIQSSTCTPPLPAGAGPGSTCTVSVTFTPSAVGLRYANLTLANSASDSPQTVPLAGFGAVPEVSPSPASLDLGLQGVNTASTQNVTLRNPGLIPVNVTSVSVAGASPGAFAIDDGCSGQSVPPGGSCTVGVHFTPTTVGPLAATLVFSDDAPDTPQAVPLSGDGGLQFYFAEGFTGPGFTETIDMLMPNHAGSARIDWFTGGGHVVTTPVTLQAGIVSSVDAQASVGFYQQVSAVVTLPWPGVAERLMHFSFASWHGSTDVVGVQSPQREWDFAEGSTLPEFSEYLTLENPGASVANTTLDYFTDGGASVAKTFGLPAQSRTTVEVFSGSAANVQGCVANGPGASCGVGRGIGGVGVSVTADQPIIVERPMYVNGHDFGSGAIADGHVAFGANSLGTRWSFAEGTTLPGFTEYLTLSNPSSQSAVVTIVYQDENGGQTTRSLTLGARSRFTVEVFGVTYGVGVGEEGVSAQVTSTIPIVAERPEYVVHDFGSGSVAGADVVVGARSLATAYGFAGASTLAGEYDYLTIQNPASQPANVTITYYTGGAPTAQHVVVPANTRTTVQMFGAAPGIGPGVSLFGLTVTSDHPVLVEKPTYGSGTNAYGATDTIGYATTSF